MKRNISMSLAVEKNTPFEQVLGNGHKNRIWWVNISLESKFYKEIKYIPQIEKQAMNYIEKSKKTTCSIKEWVGSTKLCIKIKN